MTKYEIWREKFMRAHNIPTTKECDEHLQAIATKEHYDKEAKEAADANEVDSRIKEANNASI